MNYCYSAILSSTRTIIIYKMCIHMEVQKLYFNIHRAFFRLFFLRIHYNHVHILKKKKTVDETIIFGWFYLDWQAYMDSSTAKLVLSFSSFSQINVFQWKIYFMIEYFLYSTRINFNILLFIRYRGAGC